MDDVLSMIGPLYDAAMDPSLWTSVLIKLCAFLEVTHLSLVMEDALKPSDSVFYPSFHDPEWIETYLKHYMLINPARLALVGQVVAGDTVLTTDYMTPAEYHETRFFKEFLADRGIADIAVAILEKTATRITILSANTSFEQGFATEVLRQKLELLVPHAQRAVKIARLLEHQTVTSESLASTLDALEAAVFLITATGVIVHANTSASRMLAAADVAQTVQGHLVLYDRAAGAALAQALEMAAQGDAALGVKGRSIPAGARNDRRFVLTVMPLTAGRRHAIGSPYRAIAAVCLKEAEFEIPSAASTLASHYGLTRREMAVLVASVEIGGIVEIASVMGLADTTVKSHLKAIYRKTGASRQSDLVKLVAGRAGPF